MTWDESGEAARLQEKRKVRVSVSACVWVKRGRKEGVLGRGESAWMYVCMWGVAIKGPGALEVDQSSVIRDAIHTHSSLFSTYTLPHALTHTHSQVGNVFAYSPSVHLSVPFGSHYCILFFFFLDRQIKVGMYNSPSTSYFLNLWVLFVFG